MAQGYYSLQEAAQFLGMAPDELKQMAQKNQLRSFQDRGTLRFRIPDIQELARRRGMTSDPELKLGDSPTPTPKASKTSEPARTPPVKGAPPEVFGFALDGGGDAVDVGGGLVQESPSGAKKGPKSDGKKGKSPLPAPGSDSDVKLVPDGHLPISVSDSDVKVVSNDSDVKVAPTPSRPSKTGSSSPKPKKSSRPASPQPADSGVRLVPMDSDSDVKIVGAGSDEINFSPERLPSPSDSDIRLEHFAPPPSSGENAMMLTEEINLDEEIKKQEAAQKKQPAPQAKVKPKSKLKFPTTSPFELSHSDLEPRSGVGQAKGKAKSKPDSSDFDLRPDAANPDSSDFDLTPDDSSLVLEPENSDFSLDLPDDSALALAPEPGDLKGPASGINLGNPADAGISLEDSSDMDFELSLDEGSTPKPAPAQNAPDSDSEFELSLDVDDSGPMKAADSDSEFELTLDDSSGEMLSIDGAAKAKAGGPGADSDEKDIFETDFEVPALDDESGSQVAALDTDLDSSDFDIALDDGEAATEQDSGSQVVALDEEELDDAAATVAAKRGQLKKGKSRLAAAADEPGFGDLDGDEGEVETVGDEAALAGPVREVVREKMIEPAPWGPLPTIFMFPCVIVMVVVALMGYEMVQSSAGYKQPGFLTKTIAEMMGQKIK